ncbi:chitinase [Cristinia sonorae]|uniref:Chitinase n=1 Tax=Cristinia sonorae TaxID=1940300 RepID=A0A8K0XUS1_9AGAR|nr:chitinase [Cristinia sonorae]
MSLLSFTLLALSLVGHARAASVDASANVQTVDMVSAAWYAGWHSQNFTLANVTWEKYTHMTYSFAITTPDVTKLSLDGSAPEVLPQFVETAQKNGVKALVSVGGWTGSLYFSSNVGSAANRTAFVKTITDFASQYKLDGIDFDWEYPGNQGIGCNVISPDDTTNFLSFLQELRKDPVGKKLLLTAATSITPWKGADGNPVSDVSGFANVLDYVAIMNYDINGAWSSTVAANAPLNDTCAPAANQAGSAVSAIAAWEKAGMPAHQIVLGVPSYGHSFHVAVEDAFHCDDNGDDNGILASFPKFDVSKQPLGDAWSDAAGTDVCGNAVGPGGNYDFWGLIEGGFLNKNGTVADDIIYRYDECSQTPYVYNEDSEIMVAFDDATSFAAKGNFIKTNNLRGFAMWEAGGDSEDILLDSIRKAAGFEDDEDNDEDC